MSRYIDFYLIGELVDSHGNVHYEDLKNLPTADVVEVIRCEDCRYFAPTVEWYECEFHDHYTMTDNYCSYGERREDEQIH